MGWISVKDKLPKNKQIVLIGKIGQTESMIARYYAFSQKFIFGDKDMMPTHWMLRPKPPKDN